MPEGMQASLSIGEMKAEALTLVMESLPRLSLLLVALDKAGSAGEVLDLQRSLLDALGVRRRRRRRSKAA